MFLRQGKEWCVWLQLPQPRKATKHRSVCAPHIPIYFQIMETELPPACGTCCGVAACGMPHRGGSSFLCQLELCGAVNRPRPWVLLTTVASHFQGSALNPSGSVGSFPFLVVGSEGNSSECQLCNTCSRHHQELSSYFGPCLIVWSVMEQNNSSPGYFLEEAAGPWRQSQFSVICVCDNQGTLGTCPHMS